MIPAHVTVPILPFQESLSCVEVEVGGATRTFLLDMGAGVTLLDAALAAEVARGPRRRVSGRRMTGARVEFELATAVELSLGGFRLPLKSPGVLDLSRLMPAGWPRVDGALALDVLEHVPARIDFAAGELVLGDTGPAEGLVPVPLRLYRQIPEVSLVVLVRVDAPDRELWFELDNSNTGAVVASPASAAALGLTGDAACTFLRVAGLRPFETPVRALPCLYDGNLGTTFTARRTFALELSRGRLQVSAPQEPPPGCKRSLCGAVNPDRPLHARAAFSSADRHRPTGVARVAFVAPYTAVYGVCRGWRTW